jgi:tight adherence protein B
MHAVVVALIGFPVAAFCAHVARRHAIADRLRSEPSTNTRVLPRVMRVPLVRALDDAAVSSTPEHALEVWLLVAGIAAIIGFGLAPVVGVFAGAGVLLGGPLALGSARHRRDRAIAAAVPEALEQVGAELRAGGTVNIALSAIAHGASPLAPDVRRLETRVRLGASLPDALRSWARERPAGGIEAAAGALALSSTVGGRAADALDALASSLRDRYAVAAEARALSAQGRYSAWVIGVAPIGYLACSALVDPRSVHRLFGTPGGRVCALAGVGLELLGALWMRAIIRNGDAA